MMGEEDDDSIKQAFTTQEKRLRALMPASELLIALDDDSASQCNAKWDRNNVKSLKVPYSLR